MTKKIFQMPVKRHIDEAHKMADAIFNQNKPEFHMEMYEAIADRLNDHYESGRIKFGRLGSQKESVASEGGFLQTLSNMVGG